ncbi:hypothetical protein LTR35_011465 [Friedmanniomyces endolithicus]|uniref:C2H2-type domain-containing protein n=1 Tax=Friedmanniomyces endolithicus TaxID=329885 RepID=A0A4U0VLL4_9PEZI|nr:hypothetical protein LTS09_013775 [Friedmanniomyces endolithicus]KAK0274683.1 hypothetical protein LTR35_011465 [Friedmanniomyces endolithicus]KAK0317848.1 hypothetical protein LTR82_011109 [Friedmanniomyces endolithicus]KAK0980293.1 hypothetical protein LTR54_015349 [Friedmanniomyces endolithicus]TKA49375.1 hypothetical protein B0A54_00041 [Friedmanniomyces endolithicus]
MEIPSALYSGFLAFPDTYIAANLAPISEEVTAQLDGDHPILAQDASQDRTNPVDTEPARPRKRAKLTFSCAPCGKSYTESRSLARHKHTSDHRRHAGLAPLARIPCAYSSCSKSFTREHDRRRHEEEKHNGRRRPSAAHGDSSHLSSQVDREGFSNFPVVEGKQETFLFDDDTSQIWIGWDDLAPQTRVELCPAYQTCKAMGRGELATVSAGPPRRSANATSTNIAPRSSRSPGECSVTDYRDNQSWFHDDTESEDETEHDENMEPRPDTQLSQKTTKSSGADSAIDLSDDQPHEPKRPSITTIDYRSERSDVSSSGSSVDNGQMERTVAAQRPEPQSRPKTSVIQRPGKITTVSTPTPTLCVFCDVPLSGDESKLMTHLRQHLDALRGSQPHVCHTCHTGFVHRADLDKHENSVKLHAHCGFQFDHLRPCTGHHPPPEIVPDALFTDRDSFRLCEQLRHWEFWQLRLYIEEIKRFTMKRNCETGTTYSIEALFKKSRESMSSFAISVNTYGSAPCDRGAGGQLDIGGLKHRMKMMSLKSSTTARRLPQMLRSTSNLNKALFSAVTSGDQPEVKVKVLVTLGADPNVIIGDQSILSAAAQYADVETVTALIQSGASVHTPERKFGSPLASAAHANKPDTCKALIAAGANVTQTGGKYGCPLSAAAAGGHIAIAALLLDQGADLEQEAGECFSTLSNAAARGNIEMVRFLLERRANGNHFGGDVGSPLGFAVWYGHIKTAQVLISDGVDVNPPPTKHGSILSAAILELVRREGSLDSTVEMVSLLLETGAHVNQPDLGLHNPLTLAAAHADLKVMPGVVSLLLAHGADPQGGGSRSKALQLAKKARQVWKHKESFMAVSASCDEIEAKIENCYEVIRLLKKAGATDDA